MFNFVVSFMGHLYTVRKKRDRKGLFWYLSTLSRKTDDGHIKYVPGGKSHTCIALVNDVKLHIVFAMSSCRRTVDIAPPRTHLVWVSRVRSVHLPTLICSKKTLLPLETKSANCLFVGFNELDLALCSICNMHRNTVHLCIYILSEECFNMLHIGMVRFLSFVVHRNITTGIVVLP